MPESGYFEQFIEDYFSECDEHLATLRRVLLDVESSGAPTAAQIQELARALHTLKGLSGMVGLAPAEATAHAMEDAVRALPVAGNERAPLVELLFVGERLLESAIDARRANAEPPSAEEFVAQVRQTIAAAEGDGESRSLTLHRAAPELCRIEFVPSAELAGRGVGVELVRQRIAEIGEIQSVAPHIRPSGGVVFQFVVTLRPGARPDERWLDDGMSWELGPPAPPVTPVIQHDVPAASGTALTSNVVRVDLSRLDDLMSLVGEIVITRSRLSDSLERASQSRNGTVWDDLNEANERIERQLRMVREGVMRIRLVAVGEVFERMRFAMRDVAREAGKAIRLEFAGQDTEIDKLVVDRMLEPLLHLVRNAASHGIEDTAERSARGKSVEGTIRLSARTAGDRIVFEVEDDGGGIDVKRVARRAREAGLVSTDEELGPDALLDVICSPGFSTRDTADMTSGRGVGMAVVRTTVRALGGELYVHSVLGRGTRFTIELPLTLMITDALIVEIGDQPMAVPQVALREIVVMEGELVTQFENNRVLSYRGRVVPLIDLAEQFDVQSRAGATRHVLIVGSDTQLAGLVVDRVLGLREIVVHPLADPLTAVRGVAGATELADGRVSLILDAAALARRPSREVAWA